MQHSLHCSSLPPQFSCVGTWSAHSLRIGAGVTVTGDELRKISDVILACDWSKSTCVLQVVWRQNFLFFMWCLQVTLWPTITTFRWVGPQRVSQRMLLQCYKNNAFRTESQTTFFEPLGAAFAAMPHPRRQAHPLGGGLVILIDLECIWQGNMWQNLNLIMIFNSKQKLGEQKHY